MWRWRRVRGPYNLGGPRSGWRRRAEWSGRAREGAEYIVLGTIYATPSHPGVEGSGPAAVSAVRRRLTAHRLAVHRPSARRPPPILAIGGIGADRIEEVTEAGAYGIVVGRAVWSAPDPARAALGLRRQLDRLDRRDG
ncbi:MAG: hypothetical protein F4Y14_00440 [Acidobacteria bacterium]|nr:hypothetical protein [Acidobacteriota bacterium]